MKNKQGIAYAAIFVLSALFFLSSCASVPREKTDELDGTNWTYKAKNSNNFEYFNFHRNGKYSWMSLTSWGASSSSNGTYSIEGDEIILIREGRLGSAKITAAFSADRQSFSYLDRVFTKDLW
jgi:hypothetical protein